MVNTLELIVGVLIAQSFIQASEVFIPINRLSDFQNFMDALGLSLAYFIVISGWFGYHNSISQRPHLGNLGTLRYGIDLIILFLAYYIIQVSNPESDAQYGEVFLWVIPATFICYSAWDIIKFYEYRNQDSLKVTCDRMKITFVFMALFFMMMLIYYYVNTNYQSLQLAFWQNKTSADVYFIGLTFILFFIYRYVKRRVTST